MLFVLFIQELYLPCSVCLESITIHKSHDAEMQVFMLGGGDGVMEDEHDNLSKIDLLFHRLLHDAVLISEAL